MCTLPLTTAHGKVGTLTFASTAPDIYTADEVRFLSVVAEQIALAFDNALHFDAAQASQRQLLRKNERLQLLLELTNHVVSNLELRDLLRAVVTSTRRIMGCDGVGICLPDTDNTRLRVYALDFESGRLRSLWVNGKGGSHGDVSVCRCIGDFGFSVLHRPGCYQPEAPALKRVRGGSIPSGDQVLGQRLC